MPHTPNWKTAAQISRSYVVGEERLLSYGQRGNLPLRRLPDGSILFDERAVATFFRPRGALVPAAPANQNHAIATSLGVLGTARLGEQPDEAPPASIPSRPMRHRLAVFGQFETREIGTGTRTITERKATG